MVGGSVWSLPKLAIGLLLVLKGVNVILDGGLGGVSTPGVQLDDLHVGGEKLARVGNVDRSLLLVT